MDANRDFLFGALAVQAGYIDSARLQSLLDQIEDSSQTRIVDLLCERSLITSEQHAELEDQVRCLLDLDWSAEATAKLPHAGTVAVDRTSSSAGQQAAKGNVDETLDVSPRTQADQINEATMPLPGERRDQYVSMETIEYAPGTRGRYTLTREHGRGGLGSVWLARDATLNREVALKEVIAGKQESETRFKRLVREAQITGQLEHPNIVPVYELSPQSGSASPFYTMRFLRGATLSKRIRSYHRQRRHGDAETLQLRELLDAFVAICHAVGYAHSRRVIHRDLKPSNVLLGDFGEVVVVDWGLAKRLSDPPDQDVDRQQAEFAENESNSCTREGQALGTPAYMAPEQASGHVSLTDELTDIYGLGSILFCIMTGRTPHMTKGESHGSTLELLQQICTRPTPQIRSVVPSAPRALNAICSKAMARLRSDRYATAEELARDVQCWLADEPVSAYAESATERMFRWLRRNRAFSLALASSLLVLAVAGIALGVVTTRAKGKVASALSNEQQAHNQAVAALQAEQDAKQLALQQFRRAQDAIDRSLSGVSKVMMALPGTEPLRSSLLEAAAQDYAELLSINNDDPELRREAARTRIRLADLRRLMNDFDAAEVQYQQAQQDLKQLKQQFNHDQRCTLDLAQVWSKLALLYTARGQTAEAQSFFDQAVAAYSQEYVEPEQREAQLGLAGARLNLAAGRREVDRAVPVLSLLATAEQEFQQFVAEYDDPRGLLGLAMARREWGQRLQAVGEGETGLEKLRAAEQDFQRLVAADDANADYLEGLAHTRMLLANALRLLSNDLEPLRTYQSSVDDYLMLLKLRPGLPAYRESVAVGRVNIAQMLYKAARSRDAKVHLDEAIAELIDLTQTYPQVAEYREAKANCLITLAMVLRDLDEVELTDTAFAGGAEEFRWLHDDFPNVRRHRGDLGISLMGWARAKQKQGELTAAESLYQEGLAELTAAIEQGVQEVRYRDALAWCHFYLGELLSSQDKLAAAEVYLKSAISIREDLPDLPSFRRSLIRVLAECPVEQLRDPQRAVDLATELCDQDEHNPDCYHSLAVAQLAAGNSDAARQAAMTAVELRSDPHPFDLFVLAIAEHQSGDPAAAEQSFAGANEIMQSQCPGRIELLALQTRAARLVESAAMD